MIGLHPDHENTVGSRRFVIHWCLANNSVHVAKKQQIKCILLIFDDILRQITYLHLATLGKQHLHFRQVRYLFVQAIRIQQIITVLVVDLEVTDRYVNFSSLFF